MKRFYWLISLTGIVGFMALAFFVTGSMINESLTEGFRKSYKPYLHEVSRVIYRHGSNPEASINEISRIKTPGELNGVSIYRTDGTRLYSRGQGAVSSSVANDKHFLLAAGGKPSGYLSSYTFPFAFWKKEEGRSRFSLFIPVLSEKDGAVVAVVEAGRDVSALVKIINGKGALLFGFFLGGLVLFAFLLFVIIRRFDASHERIHLESRKFGFSFFKHYDGLTRLPNRIMFMENLSTVINRERESGKSLGVMYIGLDRLKTINDGLGHEAGNAVILEIVMRLRDCTRGRDVLSRMSGDEFAIVCEGLLTNENMEMVAERIMKNVRRPVKYGDRELVVTSSVGFALCEEEIHNPERLVENANIAMRNAKRLGGNRFELFTETSDTQSSERLELEIGLWNAVERKEFLIYYQPKVNTFTGEVIGMEALLRWNHPQKGIISPTLFIPLLEETGLMVPVGDWMIYESCRQTKKWHDEGYGDLRVSVNLSMCQFISDNLVGNVKSALEKSGLPPSSLEIELTESLIADDVDRAVASLHELKELGVKISLDDFGTGYSSLSHITRFPIDTLKVDRAFIKDVTEKKEHATLTTAIVALAKSLHLEIVAEGVETLEHFNFVKKLGCDEIQGFFFSAPVPTEGFKATLQNIRRQVLAVV